MSDNEAKPASSADAVGYKSLGVASYGDIEFELTVMCFGAYEKPDIGWVWLGGKKLGYLGGLTKSGSDLRFRTHGGAPVDRALTWPEESDTVMFEQFRELWTAAYGDDGHEPLGEFDFFGTSYTAWRNQDTPSTIRFAAGGQEVGKLVGIGSHPRLILHRDEWPVYRRNVMRFKLLDLLAAKDHSP